MDEMQQSMGINGDEIFEATQAASQLIAASKTTRALTELFSFAPGAEKAMCDGLRYVPGCAFGTAGMSMVIYAAHAGLPVLESWPELVEQVFSHPPVYKDLALWPLFMGAIEAAIDFQLEDCPAPSLEPTLTGMLLKGLGTSCKRWGALMQGPFNRSGGTFGLHKIDLQILGGEQASGGDFGIVLDFDGKAVQPAELNPAAVVPRAVPLIFQAKRYVRPNATVSQRHPLHGYQGTKLAANTAASAYIFYENGTEHIPTPLPPLVKRIEAITSFTVTPAAQGSVDLAGYLLRAAVDENFAPSASSPEVALRMIFSGASMGQLSALAVISPDPMAGAKYAGALANVAVDLRHVDENPPTDQLWRD